MCKIHTLHYSCGHDITVRLSTCRCTIATRNRYNGPWHPACERKAILRLHQGCLCGNCASREDEVRIKDAYDEEDDEYGTAMLMLGRSYPLGERRRTVRPFEPRHCRKPTKELRGSLLKYEVREEDIEVEEQSEEDAAWYASWASGWS